MNVKSFVQALANVRMQDVFNPYGETCLVNDRPDAACRRRGTLEQILSQACAQEVAALWVARDLGYLGGRRTGLALTDDAHYQDHLERWGIAAEKRPCHGEQVKERTAKVIWGELAKLQDAVFLWNVFPFHPHVSNDIFSNRPHTKAEREIGLEFLENLIDLIQPRRIVAIGNDAAQAIAKIDSYQSQCTVRHPSYGGANIFRQQIGEMRVRSRLVEI